MKNIFKSIILCISLFIAYTGVVEASDFKFSLYGKYYDCNTQYALKVGTKDNCEVNCPNRIYVFKDRTCRLKNGESIPFPQNNTSVESSNCKLDEDEEDKADEDTVETYFKGSNGRCYRCNTEEPVQVSDYDCREKRFCHLNCSKRIRKKYNETSYYSVLKCPSGRPLMDRFMMCWSCNEKTPIDLSFSKNSHDICKSTRRMETGDEPYSYLK